MKQIYLHALFGLFMLLATPGIAQNLVKGVVLDKKTKQVLPGITVVIRGTEAGTTTDREGSFQLAMPSDTATLHFESIGFKRKNLAVKAGDSIIVKLPTGCIIDYFYVPYIGLSLNSGLPHTPFGGQLTLFQPYLFTTSSMQPAARAELEYRAGARASYRSATLAIDELLSDCNWNVDVAAELSRLHLNRPGVTFSRRSIGANVTWNRHRWPVWLAAGQGQEMREGSGAWRSGMEVGSQYYMRITRRHYVQLLGRVAWWQSTWQWQGSAEYQYKRYALATTYRQAGNYYREVGLRLEVKLYIRKQQAQ